MLFSTDHIWRTPAGDYLIQGALKQLPSEVELPHDIQFAAKYYLVTAAATLVRAYSEPIPYAIDDDQGFCEIHVVVGAELRSYHWIDNYNHGIRLKVETIFTGLQRVTAKDLPFDLKVLEAAIRKA